MEVGKIPNDILKNIILDKLKCNRKEVLIRPKIGEDCTAIDFGDEVCVLSSDPITGAVNEIGKLAVHVSCNDIASCGIEPMGILVTILAPSSTRLEDLESVIDQISEECNKLNVEVLGGHTEITEAVNKMLLISTAVGKGKKQKLVATSGAKDGDSIILTKSAGLEGTAIIAHDKEQELFEVFGQEFVNSSKALVDSLSVVKEGILSGNFGVTSMHDVTEGGVLGAVWEVMEASDVGCVIYEKEIPVVSQTREICRFYGIEPLKLISSGCMLITCKDGKKLVEFLENQGIKATVIGEVNKTKEKILIDIEGKKKNISQPESDHLYKVV